MSTKIHAVVDALGYPVYLKLSEGQEADSVHAIDVLSHVDITNSDVLADKGYDTDKILDYVYEN